MMLPGILGGGSSGAAAAAGSLTPITLNGTVFTAASYASTFYLATAPSIMVVGQRLFFRSVQKRAATGDFIALTLMRDDGHAGYIFTWQTDGNINIVRQNNGGQTTLRAISSGGGNLAMYHTLEMSIIPSNSGSGNTITGRVHSAEGLVADSTYDLTSGNWYIGTGSVALASVAAMASSTGIY